jgi:hypothetical protein
MTGIGIPSNHNNAPLPKPMTTSCPIVFRRNARGENWFHTESDCVDPAGYSTK